MAHGTGKKSKDDKVDNESDGVLKMVERLQNYVNKLATKGKKKWGEHTFLEGSQWDQEEMGCLLSRLDLDKVKFPVARGKNDKRSNSQGHSRNLCNKIEGCSIIRATL